MAGGKKRKYEIHETPDVSYIKNPDVAHEISDVPVTPVLKFVGGLVVFAVIVHLAVYLMFVFLERRARHAELEPSPLARQGEDRLPPEPRLQLAPGWSVQNDAGQKTDLSVRARPQEPQAERTMVLREWEQEMNNYGWENQQAGTVRVPIKDAMRLYLERQQQQQQAAPPAAQGQTPPSGGPRTEGDMLPTDSSSGRAMEKRIP